MNKTIKRSISIFMILIILSACSNLYTPYSVELYESALLGEQEGGSYREEDFDEQLNVLSKDSYYWGM